MAVGVRPLRQTPAPAATTAATTHALNQVGGPRTPAGSPGPRAPQPKDVSEASPTSESLQSGGRQRRRSFSNIKGRDVSWSLQLSRRQTPASYRNHF